LLGLFSCGKSPVTSSRVKLRFPIDSVCQVSQLTRVKLHIPIGSACQVSHLKQVKLCFPIGSTCQASQENNTSTFRLIVGFKDQVNAFSSNAFPITKLGVVADFQQTETSHSIINFQLVVDLMNCEGAVSEGAHAAPITFRNCVKIKGSLNHLQRSSFKLIVADGHHKFTELNGLVVRYKLIELIKGFVGHIHQRLR
jgi:hypothetical protein